jgi:lysine 6-dehydrogenase
LFKPQVDAAKERCTMKVLVLGGCGIQGRTAIHDLARNDQVSEVICADAVTSGLERISRFTDMAKVVQVPLDATNLQALVDLFKQADVAIDLLPRHYTEPVCQAAIRTGVSVVNTNYGYPIRGLDAQAQEAGVAIMPECGLDPGIDLVLYGQAKRRFDELHVINSYCGGFPDAAACNNPLNYKVSWTWEGVLTSTKREARFIHNGTVVHIPPQEQHESDLIHSLDFPGLGKLEALPNGDALFFTDLIGATPTIRETGRYSLRWPGWCAFWAPLKRLGFLDDTPVEGLPGQITPHQFMTSHLEPKLQYSDDEKDLVAMYNIFEGVRNGRRMRLTSWLLIERDLDTGLLAMSKGVGYPASIVAQMIAQRTIDRKGVLTPTEDIPYEPFMRELTKRGIIVHEHEEFLD